MDNNDEEIETREERIARMRRERAMFTHEERARILKMLEDHERVRWFWSNIGVAAKWVTSVGAATALLIATMKWGLMELFKWRP